MLPGFSKDTVRITLCALFFLFSLPWSLNGHLTTSHWNIEVTNTTENESGKIKYTTDSGTDNVVSLSRSAQNLMSDSKQRGIWPSTPNGENETSNQSTGRNIHDGEYNLSTTPAQPERQIIQEELTTPQKEIQKPTEGSHRPHTISLLRTEDAAELNVLTKLLNITSSDVSPEEKTSRWPMETLKATPEIPSNSDFTGDYSVQENKTVMEGNNNTTGDLHKVQPTMETTDQPSTTHPHTSAIPEKDFNKTVSTNLVKTTEREVTTDRRTRTQGPGLKTSATIKPTTMSTKNKPTTNPIYPPNGKQQANPGPAVAAVIGTTFLLMFIAIIVILLKKHKMHKKRLENPEWAGPSPFLDGDVQPNLPNVDELEDTNGKGFNKVSISRYLPDRLSKHLTFKKNTSDDVFMGDILQGSTFGRDNPNEVQSPNRKPKVAKDSTEQEGNEIQKGQTSMDSLDTKTSASERAKEDGMESKASKQTDDHTQPLSSDMDTRIKPPPLVSIDLDSLSEEAAPLQT